MALFNQHFFRSTTTSNFLPNHKNLNVNQQVFWQQTNNKISNHKYLPNHKSFALQLLWGQPQKYEGKPQGFLPNKHTFEVNFKMVQPSHFKVWVHFIISRLESSCISCTWQTKPGMNPVCFLVNYDLVVVARVVLPRIVSSSEIVSIRSDVGILHDV